MGRCKKLKRGPALISLTVLEVDTFISKTKTLKAIGSDDISMLMLKNLDAIELSYITRVLELYISNLVIPDMWKVTRIIPITLLPEELGRPISLYSSVANV